MKGDKMVEVIDTENKGKKTLKQNKTKKQPKNNTDWKKILSTICLVLIILLLIYAVIVSGAIFPLIILGIAYYLMGGIK